MNIILGQECVVGKYGMGRVTSLVKHGHIGVTPYLANYEMQFAESNVELIQPNILGNTAFRVELEELNHMLAGKVDKQDIDEIMQLSFNQLRKELFITRASLDESLRTKNLLRLTCEQLESRLEKQDALMAALKKAFQQEMAETA